MSVDKCTHLGDPNFYEDIEHTPPSQLRKCSQNTVLIFSEANAVMMFWGHSLALLVLELSIVGPIQNVLLCVLHALSQTCLRFTVLLSASVSFHYRVIFHYMIITRGLSILPLIDSWAVSSFWPG